MIKNILEDLQTELQINSELLDIYNGSLLKYILQSLKCQLSPRAFESAQHRIPPINVLSQLICKLSQIYSDEPVREVEGTPRDKELYDEYKELYDLNVNMQLANELFNTHKSVLLEPFLDYTFKPRLRVVPFDRFFVIAADPSDPLRVTEVVKIMGRQKINNADKLVLYCYTDTTFTIKDENGEIIPQLMSGIDGVNKYGKIPFVYINRSPFQVNPPADSDLLSMTKLVPILFTDVNYALMYQAFSLIYGINIDAEAIEINPNSFLSLKADNTSPHKPELGHIKPQIDSDKAIASLQAQLALWLQSRNIRPGSVGQLTPENALSGISKMVDEMDTTQDRKKQIPFFKKAEKELFDLTANNLHPVWMQNPSFPREIKTPFSSGCYLDIKFSEQIIVQPRGELLDEVIKEKNAGLISQETAMKRLNPDMTEEQIDEEIADINGIEEPNDTEEMPMNNTEEDNNSEGDNG